MIPARIFNDRTHSMTLRFTALHMNHAEGMDTILTAVPNTNVLMSI